jgi:hypothetical protein
MRGSGCDANEYALGRQKETKSLLPVTNTAI